MTAPDDVRARFEAWHDQRWPEPDNCRHKVDWRSAKHAKWTVWQAAHADLVGEVRELVDAARVVERRLIPLLSGTLRDIDHTDFIAFFTALAKFTQEKP